MTDQTDQSDGRDNLGAAADNLYDALTAAHEGLNLEQSHRLNARLVLMMMNSIGDAAIVERLIAQARHSLDQTKAD